jgi:4-amino-4-deoxy-L-arabinose transferase-like glycosyltransferase
MSGPSTVELGDDLRLPRLDPATADGADRRVSVPVAFAVVVGLAIRLGTALSVLGRHADNDEAVAGLVALHLSRGEWHPFYWGQSYGGTLELVLTAGVFRVAGPSAWALRFVPVLLAAGSAVLVWRIGRRVVSERAAVLGACAWWVFPAGIVWWSTKAGGFYWVGSCVTLGSVLVTLRLHARPNRRDALVLGVLVGLGWWTTPLAALVTGPACAWLVVRRPEVRRWALTAVAGAVVGALPWLCANVTSGFPSLGQPVPPIPTSYLQRLQDFVTLAMPRLLGLRDVRGAGWTLGPVGVIAYLGLVVAFLALLRRRPRRLELILVLVAVHPFLYALPTSTAYTLPRYAMFIGPFVALLVGAGLDRITPPAPLALVAVVATFAAVTGLGLVDLARDGRAEPDVAPVDDRPIIEALDRLGIDRAYTDHWIGYRLTFDTGERIVTDPIPSTRRPAYDREVARADRVAWVIPAGGPLDRRFEASVAALGTTAHRLDLGAYVVYTTDRPVTPEDLGLEP